MLVQASQPHGRLTDLTADGVVAGERFDYWRDMVLRRTLPELPTFSRMFKRRYGVTLRDAREASRSAE